MKRVSLCQAAKLTGKPERFLHRAILLGDLWAERVNDERHYMIRMCDLAPYLPQVGSSPAFRPPIRSSPAFCFLLMPFTLFPLVVFLGAIECAFVVSFLQRLWDTLDPFRAGVVGLTPVVTLIAAFLQVGLIVHLIHSIRRRPN